ncbi:response regulator transcription factor [Alkalicoccus daliensis]|uniref:Two component transcriptional regulator, LuxR family n=1 Tax=Alkalicoccus daliensis TaxID=745820 RepID=A0A1H0DS70_9BACI|nr:response regulator transcription factor [Alkalicoccus daliensis]SDN73030.1 two component transcriptional regulator, LuxR family [Alkalicoccus daliensis]
MIRILLAEDQGMVRQGLKMMIESDPELKVTAEASNGLEALEACRGPLAFDIAILDIRMPEMNGLEAARNIHQHWPEINILMLTTFNDDQYALEALKGGARGYMLKDADAAELIRAIRTCHDGGLLLESHVAAKVLPVLMETQMEKAPVPIDPVLTAREIAIIRAVGEGRNNKEIAETLFLSVGTVKNHISIILDKLELRDRTQLAIYAIRSQLV